MDRTNVINYFNRMDIARIIFVVNFNKNKEFHLEKFNSSGLKHDKEVEQVSV